MEKSPLYHDFCLSPFSLNKQQATYNQPEVQNIVIHRLSSSTYLSLNFFLNSDHDGKIGCSFATQYINPSHGSSRHLNQQSGRTVPHMENHPYGANPGGREISEDSSYHHVGSSDRSDLCSSSKIGWSAHKRVWLPGQAESTRLTQRARHVDGGPQQWRTGAP